MPYKPGSGGKSWLGYKPSRIVSVTSPESKFDDQEVNLAFEILTEESDFPRTYFISGKFDREADGNIKSCSLLNKLNNIFETIGYKGGVNIKGDWVDENDVPVENIIAEINRLLPSSGWPHYTYSYQAEPKKPGDKPPTRLATRVFPNNEKGRAALENFVKFMKSNGWLKEFKPSDSPKSAVPQSNLGLGDKPPF